MIPKQKNFAYIDGANLHKGIGDLGWKLDYRRFRVWLREKYSVEKAYLFIGLIPKHIDLYTDLQSAGFILVFKEVVYDRNGNAKGNCDADLVLRSVRDFFEEDINRTILISSDGDYAPLIRFWQEKTVPCTIISPSPRKKCSWLLRKTNVPIVCLGEMESKLRKNEKAPGTDGTVQGPLSW